VEVIIIIGVAWLFIHLASKKGASKLSQPSSSHAGETRDYSSPRRDEYRPQSKRERAIVDAVKTGATLHFRYTDQDGVITTRSVKPLNLERRHETKVLCLVAHCHLRNDERTFVVSKIENLQCSYLGYYE
jgi:predicted DNA-binding transcriptional regulator YafY